MKSKNYKFAVGFLALALISCSSLKLKEGEVEALKKNEAYEDAIAVKELPPAVSGAVASDTSATSEPSADYPPAAAQEKSPEASTPEKGAPEAGAKEKAPDKKVSKKSKVLSAKEIEKKLDAAPPLLPISKTAERRPPEWEDTEGFEMRRPKVDPFRVGEKVTLEVNYFAITAGTLQLETLPFKNVNDHKAYHFRIRAKSNPSFAFIYTVEDLVESYMDYAELIPYNYVMQVNEKKSVGDTRAVFDWKQLKAKTWEKRITEKGKDEKNFEWAIEPFSQNVFTAPFYLRTFTLTPGKKIVVKVADRGKNLDMTALVEKRETISTAAGTFNTVVIKPTFKIGGAFEPVGDIRLWLTDDSQKLLVKLESKIKIGTIKAEATQVLRGNP